MHFVRYQDLSENIDENISTAEISVYAINNQGWKCRIEMVCFSGLFGITHRLVSTRIQLPSRKSRNEIEMKNNNLKACRLTVGKPVPVSCRVII